SSLNLTLTPSVTSQVLDDVAQSQQQEETQRQTTTTSSVSKSSTSSTTTDDRPMTTDSVVQELAFAPADSSKANAVPPSPAVPGQQNEKQEEEEVPLPSSAALASETTAHSAEKEKQAIKPKVTATGDTRSLKLPPGKNLKAQIDEFGMIVSKEKRVSADRNQSIVTAVYCEPSVRETSYYSQRQDGSFVEHRSFNSTSHLDQELAVNEGEYLNSTTEFFPVDDQDEQVYLDQYSDEGDEFPELQFKVSKLQKQMREMRKFMRGLVQLQVEQYEPATILIQAWWRGCLVRRELRKQRVFSWYRNPPRKTKPIKYLTRTELIQSCERISTPKVYLLVTADLGAEKDTIAAIKLQAVFRGYMVRKRVHAYREGMRAATVIQARWRGYRTRNLDTRLGVEQLRFRNLKIQKAFGRVSIKLQYLQGRILALEENSLPMHEAQEEIHKELEDMADQMDTMKQDLEQGLKQLDEQVSEEKEQTTIEVRGLTERIQKLEDELKSLRNSNTSIEKQVKSLSLGLPASDDKSEQGDEEDEDYEVEYDEDGNRIDRPPKMLVKRGSVQSQHQDQAADAGSRRTSTVRPILDTSMSSSPTQIVESPVPMHLQHRGSIGSIQSLGHTRTLSLTSQPPPSPSQAFSRSFPASYSPTIGHASVAQADGGAFANGVRPHSIPYPGANNSNNNPPRPMTMDASQLSRFHPAAGQFIPSPSSTAPGGTAGVPGMAPVEAKKYASMDDFEYMQAEVDTLRLNNDRLEGLVRELTMRLNTLTANMGQFYPG
ncbi:hypothetical protein BGZ98_000617, partial [Dissophora globulifera]